MPVPNEQMLLSSILTHGNLQAGLKKGLNQKMFHIYADEFAWVEHYYLAHSKTPSAQAFVNKFQDFIVKKVEDETAHFTEEVKEDHKRYSTERAIADILKQIDMKNPDMAIQLMHDRAIQIHQDLGMINDSDIFRDNDDILNDFQLRRTRYQEFGASGVKSGFPTFDARTGGFGAGEFHVFAARSGVGKSWTLQKMAAQAALDGHTVQYEALEQPRTNVMSRIMSIVSKDLINHTMDPQALLRGTDYDPKMLEKLVSQFRNDAYGKLHVADGTTGRISVPMIAAQIERNKPDIVFVDHITLVHRNNRDFAGVSEVADDLTQLANQYGVPIVSASQLNREGAKAEVGLEHIAESDKVGQNSSGVVAIKKHSQRAMEYAMIKNRNGVGDFHWYVHFEPSNGIYREVPYDLFREIKQEDEADRD